MKKILSLLIVIAMLTTALAGCASKEEIKGSVDTNDKVETNDTKNDTKEEETTDATDILELTGDANGGVYTNEFANIKFTAPEGWTFASDAELNEIMQVSLEDGEDENKFAAELAKQVTIYSMMASNPTTGDSAQIFFQNLAALGSFSTDVNEYAESLIEGYKTSLGENIVVGEYETVTVGGSEFTCVPITADISGISMEMNSYLKKIDGYIMCIAIATIPDFGAGMDAITGMFSAIEAE